MSEADGGNAFRQRSKFKDVAGYLKSSVSHGRDAIAQIGDAIVWTADSNTWRVAPTSALTATGIRVGESIKAKTESALKAAVEKINEE